MLACLEDEFVEFAHGFCRGDYLLWLGSGISRDVVPAVPALIRRMLEFLRTNVDPIDSSCRFRKALDEVLEVSGLPEANRASLDVGVPIDGWPEIDDIVGRLVDRYSDVLNVQVGDEAADFLVWTGLDVPTTYGSAGLEPDVEHYCVAVLMLEGVVRSAPTTNWDGLVEVAMERLTGRGDQFLRVIVTPTDFREPERTSELVKFHGCAVRAADNEEEYRDRLIARRIQISGWTNKPENQMMKNHLEFLFASRPAFLIGLSAQDADIHSVFHQATHNLVRAWPTSPPAVVFAEQTLHHHHKHVLQVTYADTYAANADEIGESALLGAYAKPALVGVVLLVLADKLCALIEKVPELGVVPEDIERLRADLRSLRDQAGALADEDPRSFLDAMTAGLAFTLNVFRFGTVPDPGSVAYQPVSMAPVDEAMQNPDFPAAALGRLAIAASLIGRGLVEDGWTVAVGRVDEPTNGVVRVATDHRRSDVFFVATPRSLSQLEVDGIVDLDDDEVLVLQAEVSTAASTRSPRARYGRTGVAGARLVDLEDLCATVGGADELFEAFRLEGGL